MVRLFAFAHTRCYLSTSLMSVRTILAVLSYSIRTSRGGQSSATKDPIEAFSERAAVLHQFLKGQSPEFIRHLETLDCDKYMTYGGNRVTNAVNALMDLFSLDGRKTKEVPASSSGFISINEPSFFGLFQNRRSRRSAQTDREIVASAARLVRKVRQELYRETDEPVPIRKLVRRLVDDPPEFMTQMVCISDLFFL